MLAASRLFPHSAWPYHLLRLGLGALFIWAGGVKLVDPPAFARLISGYDLVPEALLLPVAVGLPLLELAAGAGLVFDRRGSMAIICGLLCLFLAMLGYGILTGLEVDCGCFSASEIQEQNGLKTAFLRDVGMLATALYLCGWRWARARVQEGKMVCGYQQQTKEGKQ